MALLVRIYLNAVFGALGGLLGWLLFGIFGDKQNSSIGQQLLGGAFIGGLIGYLVVSLEAIRDRSLLRFCPLASYGVLLGALGWALGMWLGEQVNYYLVQRLLFASTLRGAGEVLSRGLGWMFLGLAVGLGEGIAARSLGKLSYGTMGGVIGGFVGGALFGFVKTFGKSSENTHHRLVGGSRPDNFGACIRSLVAPVPGGFPI